MKSRRPHPAALVILTIASLLLATPAFAASGPLDLLSSYIGKWRGAGQLVGGDQPQDFRCRMIIARGDQAKINYSGRCTLVNMNLSIAGTIAFDIDSHRYQAAMSSNAGFTGYAVGIQRGGEISFDLAQEQKDTRGNDVKIGATIHLIGDSITVDYKVEFNNSGKLLTAEVPFSREG